MDNTLIVKFVADESISREGFTARYEFLDASEACGGDFYQTSGVIRSPGYPNYYPHLSNCVWVLHARNSRQITLNVTNFNTEFHEDCKYDYLEIRNGGYKTSPLIGKYCGNRIMPNIQSHSNLLRLEFKTDQSMSAPGFEIQFDSSVVGCGGTLTASHGSIVSPNYPNSYPMNADCEWLIRVSEGSKISVSIVEIDIEEHQSCRFDYLQIFDGPTESSKSLVRMCNNQQNPGPIVSKSNAVLIRFRSDFSEEAGGFNLVYQTLCNNELTKRQGVIESPNFPNSYPHNHNCTWTLKAPIGSNISLVFSHMFIEGDVNCSLDYVEVKEIQSPAMIPVSLGKFCGDMTRPLSRITTTTNTAVVQLITDRSVSREGFRLEWSFIGCGDDIIDRSFGYITSPNYPNGYPLRTLCRWHIWYPPGNSVELTIEDLDLELADNCMFDFLRVYSGEDQTGPALFSGCHALGSTATVLTSHGNEMFVHFGSDISVAHRGFKAKYRKLDTGCGGLFTASEASILSPNFPDPYSPTDACEWLIKVGDSSLVELQFYEFEMPEAVNCSQGHVAIYDGNSTSAPLLLRHCGSKPQGIISSTSSQMMVTLIADGVSIAKGFKAHYKSGCGRRLLADNGGEIKSLYYPNTFHDNFNCSWILYTSQIGEKVSLSITNMNVPSFDNCTFSSLIIYDGDMEDSPVIGEFCGHHLPPTVISRGSILHIFAKNMGSFRAVYGLLSQHCGGVFTSVSGSFSSPGYPTNYDMEMECVWTIEASPGSKLRITFQDFHLESSDYCNTDYVEIHENDPSGRLIGKYCGNSIPSNVTSAHKLWIKFRSDDIGTAPGFMAHFELLHGLTITGTSGEIASPGYPLKHNVDGTYEWTIVAPDGMFVSVYFQEMGIPTRGHETLMCYTQVKLIDGFDDESPVLGSFCGYTIPEPVVSTGNVLKVVYQSTMHFPSLFYLRWSAVNESGALISGASCLEEHIINATDLAVIQSPNFPLEYPNEFNCTYVIRTVPTHHIDLQFHTFNFEGTAPECAFDHLESHIAPKPHIDEWILNSTLCGSMPNARLTSPNNVLMLKIRTDRSVKHQGFNATARAECGGQLFGRNGVIRSSAIYPNIQNISRSDTFQCEWRITVKSRRTIQLTFENFDIESDSSCSNNYILIRNGGSATSPFLGNGRYCGSNPPVLPETSSNQAYVQLVYKPESGRSPLFDLRYSIVTMGCGGYIYLNSDIPSAEVTSPNYPSKPTHDAECDWIIVSPAGTRLRVDFETEFNLGPNCYWGDDLDYLELYDGGTDNADIIRRYCYRDQPSSVMTTGNALFVRYVTGSDDKESGFKANIKIAHCGGTISSMFSSIQSPNFPANYGSGMECEWLLKMPYGYHLMLNVTEFQTPAATNCSLTDYLEVREMSSEGDLLGTYCGNPTLPIEIEVPGPTAYLKFKSNAAGTAKGFSIAMSGNFDDGCGGRFEDPSGVITSPRYPNALTHPRDCYWSINAPAGRKVKVTFLEMNLPFDETRNACSSFVAVFNATHRYQRWYNDYRFKFCGTSLPAEIDSSSSGLTVVFNSHGLSAGQGFKLRYSTDEEALCGGVLPTPSGELSCPNFTVQAHSLVDCKWSIEMEENQTLLMKFDYLDLPGSMANYCRDSILYLVSDGRYLAGYCGNYTGGFTMTSAFRSNVLRLLSTLESPIGGFHATYNVSNCGGLVDGANAEVTSPGYPNNYPPGIHCSWFLKVPYGEIMQITVVDLRLEDDCTKDYLLIRNGRSIRSPVLGRFCGSTTTVAPISSSSEAIMIEFHSDEYGTAPGFKISTTEVQRGCGGLIHTHEGNFTSPNYPSRYSNNVECVWTIEYTPGYLIEVEFSGRFDIEMDSSCSKDYIQFEDMDEEGRWTTPTKKCGSVNPEKFVSKSNKLRILFHSNDRIVGDGFNLFYSTDCGGKFRKPSGDIFSPNFPDFYTNYLNCSYEIGKQGDYITLSFDDNFSVEGQESCVFDYVEIFQKQVTNNYKQGPYCGNIVPASRTLMGPVTVRFITDNAYVAHGFKLHYEILKCGGVLTSPSGVISSPNTTGSYVNLMDCTWRLIAPSNKVIQLRFLYFHMFTTHGCHSDHLDAYDGNRTTSLLIGRFCGDGVQSVKSTGNTLTLKYHSSHVTGTRGFAAYYHYAYGPQDGCGGRLNATSAEITSPDIDSDGFYEPNLDCGWVIDSGYTDTTIKIEFNSLDLQMPYNGTCQADYLELREFDPEGMVIGRHCGNVLPQTLMTSADYIFVHFHSDESGSNTGFKMTYTIMASVCGKSSRQAGMEPQILTSPNYPSPYPVNLRCFWRIMFNRSAVVSFNQPVEIEVTDMNVPCGGGDYLQFMRIKGTEYTAYDTTRDCGNTPPQVLRFRHGVKVTLNTDGINNGGYGFNLTYRIASCNASYTSDGGVIVSEPYMLRYNTGNMCRMNITVAAGKTVSLYFLYFGFSSLSEQCVNSYMKIYDGTSTSSPLLATYCGGNVPNPVFSTGNSLHLEAVYQNRMALYHMTYMASEKANGCGGTIFASDGALTSPLYPQPYNRTEECVWYISNPGFHTVSVYFQAFALNSTDGCDVNYLELFEGSTTDVNNRIARYCGQDVPSSRQLRSNGVVVKLVTDSTNDKPGFSMTFRSSGYIPAVDRGNLAQKFPLNGFPRRN